MKTKKAKLNIGAKKPYVASIKLKRIYDDNADTSYLGTFSNRADEGAINHRERSGSDHRVYEWFNPANPEYAEQEYKRMLQLENGAVCFYGVRADAEIHIPGLHPKSVRVMQITSAGLWGIESDSDGSYFDEVGKDELEDLRLTLAKLNVDLSDWKDITKNLEFEDK